MKTIIVIASLLIYPVGLKAQESWRWSSTNGDQSLSAAATAMTIQQPAVGTSGILASIDQIVIYCSVACNATVAVNGTAAATTAGTITPLLPTPANVSIPLNAFTSSNVGAGTAQGGITHIPAGGTVVLCFSQTCGAAAQLYLSPGGGTGSNITVSIASITGVANIIFIGRSFK